MTDTNWKLTDCRTQQELFTRIEYGTASDVEILLFLKHFKKTDFYKNEKFFTRSSFDRFLNYVEDEIDEINANSDPYHCLDVPFIQCVGVYMSHYAEEL